MSLTNRGRQASRQQSRSIAADSSGFMASNNLTKSRSENRPRSGGKAHFAPRASQNEPVPAGSRIGCKRPQPFGAPFRHPLSELKGPVEFRRKAIAACLIGAAALVLLACWSSPASSTGSCRATEVAATSSGSTGSSSDDASGAESASADDAPSHETAPLPAVVIELDKSHTPVVVPLAASEKPLHAASRGLVVWAEKGRDHWGNPAAQSATKSTRPGTATTAALASLNDAERGGPLPGAEGSLFTTQLEPLVEPDIIRAVALVTPGQGRLLNPRITIRRRDTKEGGELPKAILVLSDGTTEARIPIGQGVSKLAFTEIAKSLPAPWQAGLPPGQYTLRVDAGLETVTFTVEGEAARRRVMKPLDELLDLLGRPSDPLYIQVAVEHLLAQRDEHGREQPYLADALDLLESVAEEQLSPPLREERKTVLWRLGVGKKPIPTTVGGASTGNADLDRARGEIVQGWWTAAQEKLKPLARSSDRRTRALAAMYQGVIYTESGLSKKTAGSPGDVAPASDTDAESCFRAALAEFDAADTADLYRAHSNFANLLLRQAQDQLSNHAFQMAAGVEHPLLSVLSDWREARLQFEQALELAKTTDEHASIEIGISRLYALLADILGALQPEHAENPYAMLRAAATKAAGEYAHQAAAALVAPGSDPRSAGVAAEMLGHLAFRARRLRLFEIRRTSPSGISNRGLAGRAGKRLSLAGDARSADFGLRVRRGVDSRSARRGAQKSAHLARVVGNAARTISGRSTRPQPRWLLCPAHLRL